ncbi:hypothetical protein CJF31_00003954 [Rutstroemia sp. NJR-2017a BVV2]|nr:hypothetical protein CJF31_00003954 [Rutstroemia sp. NJR-2017a BVV2]
MSSTTVKPKVLFILSSHPTMGDSGNPTGWYLPEFAHPYEVLAPHADITIASPAGGAAPLDPASVEASKEDKISMTFHKEKEALWKNTEKLESFLGRASEFDAIFYVGGHGPMYDLATLPSSHALILEFHSHHLPISAVCHGPAALLNITNPTTSLPLINSLPVTGFSNAEEEDMDLMQYMPFPLETKLNEASGGKYEKAADKYAEKVVVAKFPEGGLLITGQNPASAGGVGKAILEALNGEKVKGGDKSGLKGKLQKGLEKITGH